MQNRKPSDSNKNDLYTQIVNRVVLLLSIAPWSVFKHSAIDYALDYAIDYAIILRRVIKCKDEGIIILIINKE